MRELTHEEKTAIFRIFLGLGFLAFAIIFYLVLQSSFGSSLPNPDPVPLPDYHMNPFGGLTP